jgi:prohibitin 2
MNRYALPLDGKSLPPTTRARWRWFMDRHLPMAVIYLMVATLVAVVLFPHVAVTVPSGHVGVLWKRFGGGTVLDPRQLRDEGFHLIWPWDELFIYDLRLQSFTESYNAISSDGVNLTASINARYRLQRDGVAVLHRAIGPNYLELIARPGIGSLTREVIAHYNAEQVYSTARQEIQDKIRERTLEKASQKMMGRFALSDLFILYDTLLYGIELPTHVVNAINRKTEQYYISEEFRFRVEREKRESERKRIEAEGVRDFQQIVSQGISDSYLRWRGIEATLQLSQSTNAKTVIIGNAKDGLPVILGNVDMPAPAGSAGETPAAKETTTAGAPAEPFQQQAFPTEPTKKSPPN